MSQEKLAEKLKEKETGVKKRRNYSSSTNAIKRNEINLSKSNVRVP